MPIQDATFLLAEAREKPMHVGGLQVFDLPEHAGEDWVTDRYQQALDTPEVMSRLARRPVRGVGTAGAWAWEHDQNLDLSHHVRHSALPHPHRIRELLALVSRLHGTMLHRSRPLWEAHFIEGVEQRQFAVYTKIHHALVDGVSAMKMLERSLSVDPDERGMPPAFAPHARPPRPPRAGANPLEMVQSAVGGAVDGAQALSSASIAGLRKVLRAFGEEATALPFQAPKTIFNVPITGARRVAADRWPLPRIKAAAKGLDVTLNDIVLAMSSGALRTYLLEQDALPDDSLVSAVPVSLHQAGEDGESGNAVGIILCRLGTNLADPAQRLAMIRRSMEQGKGTFAGLPPLAVMLLSALDFGPAGLTPLLKVQPLQRTPFNLVISNVPGPARPLYFDGARMTGHYPLSIPYDGQAMNITVTSYDDHLNFGLVGCRQRVPSLQRLLLHLETALLELEALAGIE
nr:putative wax ester synthase/acyl-CoA:diacylglycerol acyltransferase [uncultured bacterium]